MQHVHAQIDKAGDELFHIAAGMQPEMHSERVHMIDHPLIIRCEKLVKNIKAEKSGMLGPEIVAGEYGVNGQLFFCAGYNVDIEIGQLVEKRVHGVRAEIEIDERVFHPAYAPASLK